MDLWTKWIMDLWTKSKISKYNGLVDKIKKVLEAESVRVDPTIDDNAYQIHVIIFKRLKNRPLLDTERKETTEVVADPHCKEAINERQEDSKLSSFRAKRETKNPLICSAWRNAILTFGEGRRSKVLIVCAYSS